MFETIWLYKIFLFIVWYILLPGGILHILLLKKDSFINIIGSAFAFGFVLFTIIVEFGYWFKLSTNNIHYIISAFNIIFLLFLIFKNHRKILGFRFKFKLNIFYLSILAISLLGFYISLFSGWYPRGDASVHLQGIRSVLSAKYIIHPTYSMYNSPIIPDHAFEVYYYFVALIIKYSGLQISVVWHYTSPILALFVPFSLVFLLRKITLKTKIISFSLLSFFIISVFFNGLQNGSVYDMLVYPNRIYLWLILPISLGFYFMYLNNPKKKYLILSIVIAFSQIFIHQSGFLFYLLILGGNFVIFLFKKKYSYLKPTFYSIVSLLIISIPILFLKYQYNKDYITGASDKIWHTHYSFYKINEFLFAFPLYKHPFVFTAIISLIIVIIAFFSKKIFNKNIFYVTLAFSSIIIPAFIVYNPFIVPFLGKIISFVAIGRMLRLPMYFLIFGGVFYFLFKWIVVKYKLNPISSFNINISSLLALTTFFVFTLKLSGYKHEYLPITEISKKYIKPNSIIISDLLTSSDIVSLMNVKSVGIQFNGAVDLVNSDEERADINSVIISNEENQINSKKIKPILDKYNINYIIVNKSKYRLIIESNYLLKDNSFKLLFDNNDFQIIRYLNK